jgi:hypothetical protein
MVTNTALTLLSALVVLGVAMAVTSTRPEPERPLVFEGTLELVGGVVLAAMSLHVLWSDAHPVGFFLGFLALALLGAAIHSLTRLRALRRSPDTPPD